MLCRQILNDEELSELSTLLADAQYEDGVHTAGYRARRVKHNEQLRKPADQGGEFNRIVFDALKRNRQFQRIALPQRIHRPLFSRYRVGMNYGRHVDDAIMGSAHPIRADIALTLFLSEPSSYDGGELCVETPYGEQTFKPNAGDAVVYPASTLHRVSPVTRGERLAAVTWVQSKVRDTHRREILCDLSAVRETLHRRIPEEPATDLAFKAYSNLLRLWVEP